MWPKRSNFLPFLSFSPRGDCVLRSPFPFVFMFTFGLSLVAARISHAQLATSSWPSFRHDAALSGRAQVNGPTDPVVHWTAQVGVGTNLSPVIAQDGTIIFTSARNGVIYALNPDSTRKWTFKGSETGDIAFDVSAVIDVQDSIYLGSLSLGFLSLKPDSTLNWRKEVGGNISHAANIDRFGNIYFVAGDNALYSFSTAGERKWSWNLDNATPSGTPAIGSNDLIYAPAGKYLYVYDRFGNRSKTREGKWSHPQVTEIGWVMVNNERVYIGSSNAPVVVAFNLNTGAEAGFFEYRRNNPNFRHPCFPAVGNGNSIIFTDSNVNSMFALTADLSLKPGWPHSYGRSESIFETTPVVDDSGRIYIVSHDERYGLIAIKPEDGDTLWTRRQVRCKQDSCNTDCSRSLAFGADGTLYVPTSDTLYAVRQKPHADSLKFLSHKDLFFCYDSTLQTVLRVKVRDQYRDSFPNHPVAFRIEPNGPAFNRTTSDSGIAQFTWNLEKRVGTQRVKVISAGPGGKSIAWPDSVFTAHIAAPQISGASQISFGTILLGAEPINTVSVKNMSRCPLRVYKPVITINPGNAFTLLGTHQDSTVLDSSEVLTFEVKFKPNVRGDYTGTLLLRNSDHTRPDSAITLHGIARAPEIEVKPDTLRFDTVCLGESLTLNSLTVTNKGDTTLRVGDPHFSNPAFASTQKSFSLEPNQSKIVPVTFKPRARQSYNDTLTLSHDDPLRPAARVTLLGVGEAERIAGITKIDFDTTALHDSAYQAYQIKALGFCALGIDSIKIVGKNSSDFTCLTCDSLTFPFDVPARRDTMIGILFKPGAHGAREAEMQIWNGDALNNPFRVKLQGLGVGEPEMTVKPMSLSFLETCVGLTRVDSVLICSTGSAPLVVTGFSPPTDSAFTIKDSSFILEKGESTYVRVCFSPYRKQSYNASFQIFSNARTAEISLRGVAAWPEINKGDSVLVFSDTWICQSSTQGYGVRKEFGSCDLLMITPSVIVGPHAGDFAIVADSLCSNYPPQSALRFCLRFTPSASGWRTAKLVIESNAEPVTVTLRGYGKPDTLAPEAPKNLAVDKTEWSRTNGFVLTWTNPKDTCGIAAAYYQIGDSINGERRNDISSMKINAPDVGSYKVYVWLEDGRGNANRQQRDSVLIKFDNVPPRFDHYAKEFAPVDKAIEIHAEVVEPAQESGVDPEKFQLRYSPGGKSLQPRAQSIFDKNGMAFIPAGSVTPRGVEYAIEAQDSAGNVARWPNWVPGFHSIKIQLSPGRIDTTQAGGEGREYYRVRSLPFDAEEKNAAKVFPTNFVRDKIARAWDIDSTLVIANSNFPFREYDEQANFTDMRPGRAILLITARKITLSNGAGHTVRTDQDFFIDVRPGWNLIASPFYFEIPLQNLTPKFPGAELYHFIDGDWRAASSLPLFKLRPWEGYAIKISDAAPRVLRLHPSEHDTTRALPQLAKPNWTIKISASSERAYDHNNVIGVADGAALEWDEYELLEPPRHTEYFALYFPQEHWQAQPELYATDFRPPTNAGYEWRFRVETNLHGEEVILRFDNLASVPRAYEVYLRDEQSARVVSLRQERQYSFRATSTGSIYHFRMLVGDTAFVRSELPQATVIAAAHELLPNYPNPFNPATNIAFALPRPERVSLVIYDVKGRAVRTLLDNAAKSAGYHSAVWNGKDDHGAEAASGLYFVCLTAGNKVLTRKLAFIK